MKDDEPTPEEQRQAEALARALAGETSEAALAPEALEAAALLRYAHSDGRLDPARQEAIGARLRSLLRDRTRARRRARWIWLVAPLFAGATAAVVLGLGLLAPRATLPRVVSLPPPAPALLTAQAEAARGQARALGHLDLEMRAYRRALFERLQGTGQGGR